MCLCSYDSLYMLHVYDAYRNLSLFLKGPLYVLLEMLMSITQLNNLTSDLMLCNVVSFIMIWHEESR